MPLHEFTCICGRQEEVLSTGDRPPAPVCTCGRIMTWKFPLSNFNCGHGSLGKPKKADIEYANEGCMLEKELGP